MANLDSVLKSRDMHFFFLQTNVYLVKAMVFLVVIYRWLSSPTLSLDHEEGWALKNWCFQTVMLEKTLESPLDSKEFKPVSPKWNQSWIFNGRAELKLLYFGHLMWRANLLEKTLTLGKIEGRRRATEDEMVGWHHWLSGHEFRQTLGCGEGQWCSPWGHKQSNMTYNWTTMTLSTLITTQEYFCLISLSWLLAIIWFLSIPAETNQAPFYLTKGESELVSGFNSEHATGPFALFFLAEYANITIISMFFTILFIGAFCDPHKPEIYSIYYLNHLPNHFS